MHALVASRCDLRWCTDNCCVHGKAELTSSSMDALKKGLATPGFKKVTDDLGNFATGGLTALIGAETK